MASQSSADLAERDRSLIEWAECRMPARVKFRSEIEERGSLRGVTIGAPLHLTLETAAFVHCLKRAGPKSSCAAHAAPKTPIILKGRTISGS
jgi:S-adenosylhomocysteine hydrolase